MHRRRATSTGWAKDSLPALAHRPNPQKMEMKAQKNQSRSHPAAHREKESDTRCDQRKSKIVSEDVMEPSPPLQRFVGVTGQEIGDHPQAVHIGDHARKSNQSPLSSIQAGRVRHRPAKQQVRYRTHASPRFVQTLSRSTQSARKRPPEKKF